MFEKAFVCILSSLISTAGVRLWEAMTLGSACPPSTVDTDCSNWDMIPMLREAIYGRLSNLDQNRC